MAFILLISGLLTQGRDCLVCCTPAGVMAMLKAYDVPIAGQRCVVIGRSNMVGKPVAQLMLQPKRNRDDGTFQNKKPAADLPRS